MAKKKKPDTKTPLPPTAPQDEQASPDAAPILNPAAINTLIVASDNAEKEQVASVQALADRLNLRHLVKFASELTDILAMPAPYPRVIITVGHEAGFVVPQIRQLAPHAFFLHLGNPRRSLKDFDMVLAPDHDLPVGHLRHPHVIPLRLGLSRLSDEQKDGIVQSSQARHLRLKLPGPRLAFIIGSQTPAYRLTHAIARRLLEHLIRIIDARKGSLMVATTPATSPVIVRVCEGLLTGENHLFKESRELSDCNDFLGSATHIATTWESPARLATLCTFSRPLYMLPLPERGRNVLLDFFYRLIGRVDPMVQVREELIQARQAYMLAEGLRPFKPSRLDEMERISEIVRSYLTPRMDSLAKTA